MRIISKLRKRGLAMFMALVMCLSLLPTTAMAAAGTTGTSNQTRIVPGVATPVAEGSNTYSFPKLEIAGTGETAIGELDIWFATGVGDAVKDSINVQSRTVTAEGISFTITVTAIADSLAEKTKGKHLKIEGPDSANPKQQNEAWKTFLTDPENLTVTLTSDSFDYAVCFGSIPKDFAYNPVNGHYYTYVKTNDGKQGTFEWARAKEAAHQTKGPIEGQKGYLITITTEQEELFVERLFDGKFWTAGTRNPDLYPTTTVTDEVEKLNVDTFGETVVGWAKNGDDSPHGTAKGNGAWFWGDGPEDELGLIYYPFAVNPANRGNSRRGDDYEKYAAEQWDDPAVSDLVKKYSGKDYKGTYVNSDRELYYHWAQDGIYLIEPNDNTGNDPKPYNSGGELVKPEHRELYMHVYGPSSDHDNGKDEHLRWNDYASTDSKIEGYLVEFDGTKDMQATAYISPVNGTKVTSNFKDTGDQVMIVPGIPEEIPEIVSKREDGKPIPDGTVSSIEKVTTSNDPTEYKVVTTFTEGDDSYYSEKIVKVYNVFDYLALSLKCTTDDDDHGVKYYDLLGEDKENNLSSEIVVTATPVGESDGNFYFTITPRGTRTGTYDTDVEAGDRKHVFASTDPSALVKMSYDAENKEWSASYKLTADAESWTDAGNKQAVNSVEKFIVPFDVECVAELHNVRKELVKSPEGLEDTLKSGVLFLDDPSTYGDIKVESSTIKLGKDESVKLLYKITVTGTKGANYTVSDTGATFLPQTQTSVSGKLGDGQNDGANTTEGLFTDVLYAYRTYTRDQIEASKAASGTALINTVELKAGDDTKVKDPDPEDPDDPKKTDDEEVPAKRVPDVTKSAYSDAECTTPATASTKGETLYYQLAIDTNGDAPDGKKTLVKSFKIEDTLKTISIDADGTKTEVEAKDENGKPLTVDFSKAKVQVGDPKQDVQFTRNDGVFTLETATTETIYVTYSYRVPYSNAFNGGVVINEATVTVSTKETPTDDDPSGTGRSEIGLGYTITVEVVNGSSTLKDDAKWDTNETTTGEKDVTNTYTLSVSSGDSKTVHFESASDSTNHYILDSVTVNGKKPGASYTPDENDAFDYTFKNINGNITMKVVYAIDNVGNPDDPKGNGPDGVADKYQVKVTFLSDGGDLGPTKTKVDGTDYQYVDLFKQTQKFNELVVYVNLLDKDGNFAEDGQNTLGASALYEKASIPADAQKNAQTSGGVIPAVGNHPYVGYGKPGKWLEDPSGKTVVKNPAGYTYTYKYDANVYHVTYDWNTTAPASAEKPTDNTDYFYGNSFTAAAAPPDVDVKYGNTLIGTWHFTGWTNVPDVIKKNVTILGGWAYQSTPSTGKIGVEKTTTWEEANVGDTVTWTVTVSNNTNERYDHLSLVDNLTDAEIQWGRYTNPGRPVQDTNNPPTDDIETYTLTIQYVYADSTEPFSVYTAEIAKGTGYSVPSPVIPGFTADQLVVVPEADAALTEDVMVTVIYTADVAPDSGTSDDETPIDETPDNETPNGGTPDGEIPVSEDVEGKISKELTSSSDAGLNPEDFSLNPGAVAVFTVTYKVKANDDTLSNHVDVMKNPDDPNDPDKEPEKVGEADSDPVDVLHPNLAVTKVKDSASADPAKVGDIITWTITIINNGDGTAYEVNVTDENADTLSQTYFDSIAPGGQKVITATHTVTGSEVLEADGKFYNTVVVGYREDPDDPAEAPKTTDYKDKGTEIPVDLAVTKAASVSSVYAGNQFTYTITVTNNGHAAENVTVTDALDSRLAFVSATLNGSRITPDGNVYTIGSMANAASATLTITVRVNDGVPAAAVIPNTAWAADPADPDGLVPSNTVNVTVTVIIPIPDIPFTPTPTPVTPTPTPTAPTPGTTITDDETPLGGSVGLNDTDHFAYVIGYEDDTVRPLNNITRAEAATIFFRLMTDEFRQANWSTTNDFSDVKAGDWYNNAVSTCANAGVLKGYDDGTFRPNAPITRAEFASMAAGFMDEAITDDGTGDFSDTANHWAAAAIRRAAKAGWVTGTGNKFNPDEKITRAEVMTIVNRMLDRTPDKDHMLPEMKKWTDNPESEWYYEAVQEATNEHDYERDELNVETWTELLTVRDWKALETEWANNGGASAPKADDSTADPAASQRRVPDGI